MRRFNGIPVVFLLLAGAAVSADDLSAMDAGGTETLPWSSGISGPSGASGTTSTICQFMSGPKAHGWHDYAPLTPAALGSACRDGVGSAGIVVAKGHGQQY